MSMNFNEHLNKLLEMKRTNCTSYLKGTVHPKNRNDPVVI